MAPGNLYIGYHRSHFKPKPYPLRTSTARNCSRITMEVTKQADDSSKIDVGSTGKVNGGSENNPNLDSNCRKNMGKGKIDGDGNGSAKGGWLTESRLRTQIRKLRSLSLLHLDVIDQQQRKLSAREKELSKVRSEKHTLEQRLERIQRRTSLAEKSSKGSSPTSKTADVNTPVKRKLDGASSPVLKRTALREGASVPSQSRLDQLSRAREKKRQKQQQRNEEAQRQSNGSNVDTDKDKSKDNSSETAAEKKVLRLEDHFMFTDVLYPTLQDLRINLPEPGYPTCTSEVQIPTWRTTQQPADAPEEGGIEVIDDETYDRRHSKMEQEEKKRKRWDAQRIRELRTVERLEWRAVQKEMAKYAHIVTTYSTEPHDAKRVEVSESIPVVAFGALIPKLKDKGFSLPWFNLADKERDETRRHTRSCDTKK